MCRASETTAQEKAMHPFPVDPKQIRDPLEDQPDASAPQRSEAEPMPMRRRSRDAGRAVLGVLFVALIAVVLVALL
jgi:ferric-dicitrate binding protein FerR (iron transport regulator)